MKRLLRCCLAAWLAVGAATAVVAADLPQRVREAAQPLTGAAGDYDALLAAIGDARIVMLGEPTHGSREPFRERARITQRLIEEKGFAAVVLEAPWEPLRRLDRYVRGEGDDTAAAAFGDLRRFPRWLVANEGMREFAAWLRERNRKSGEAVRLFGMDLYSLPESARTAAAYWRQPAAAEAARRDYACFGNYLAEPQDYGHAVEVLGRDSCGAGARRQLALMQIEVDAADTPDEDLFAAWQGAQVAAAAENYYRAMYRGEESSWNLRERFMAGTLDRLLARLDAPGKPARIVVWAHNIHQGDARATDQAVVGEVSIGQLMRERHPDEVFIVGFTTYTGSVRAASQWGGHDRIRRLRPALPGSWSARLHAVGMPAALWVFAQRHDLAEALSAPRPDRAVGVVYVPHDERASHYFNVSLSRQFDAVVHWDRSQAMASLPSP